MGRLIHLSQTDTTPTDHPISHLCRPQPRPSLLQLPARARLHALHHRRRHPLQTLARRPKAPDVLHPRLRRLVVPLAAPARESLLEGKLHQGGVLVEHRISEAHQVRLNKGGGSRHGQLVAAAAEGEGGVGGRQSLRGRPG